MAIVNCPECNREISDKAKACPHCGYPVKPEKYEYALQTSTENSSFLGGLMHFCAVLEWVGGLIASIFLAQVPVGYRTEFSFWVMLLYLAVFTFIGFIFWSVGNVLNNIEYTKSYLENLRLIKHEATPKQNKPTASVLSANPFGGKPIVSSVWTCSVCGTDNFTGSRYCEKCSAKKSY